MPQVTPVPPSGKAPLSSATRKTDPGTEYIDLAKHGYVEEEYYMSGVAPAITADGKALFDVPYITRILVRKPKDPKKFNGTVVIDPFTWFGERGASWIMTRDYLVREGYAYVGYTINMTKPEIDPKTVSDPDPLYEKRREINLDFMRTYDYARYAPLGTYYDPARFERGGLPDPFIPQAQGIGAQLALLLKSNLPTGPRNGLNVSRVYVNSWAVTAQVWMDYLDQGRHQQWRMPDGRPLIDAYMTGRMNFGIFGKRPYRVRMPHAMPADAPFVMIYSQNETLYDVTYGYTSPPDSDQPKYRVYDVLGASHLRLADFGTWEIEQTPADFGKGDDPRCTTYYDEPFEVVASALLDGMDRWVRTGTPMRKAPRAVLRTKGVVRDPVDGNMVGGVRPPWIKVPAATYMTMYENDCQSILESKVPYDRARLRRLYGTYGNYARKYEAAKRESIKEGFLLPEDAARVTPVAKGSDF